MAVVWKYTPPSRNAVPIVQAAAETAVEAAAEHLLAASQALVPVDTGALQASGEVTADGLDATVSYGRSDRAGRDGRDTADYAVPVHERMDANHPAGGQAKFLEQPMNTERDALAKILAAALRKAL